MTILNRIPGTGTGTSGSVVIETVGHLTARTGSEDEIILSTVGDLSGPQAFTGNHINFSPTASIAHTYTNSGTLVLSASNPSFDKTVRMVIDSSNNSSAIEFSPDFYDNGTFYVAASGTINIAEFYCRDAATPKVSVFWTQETIHSGTEEEGAWAPTDLANCVVWLAPDSCRDATGSLPADGVAVAQWLDKSGEANHFTGVNTPLYDTNIIGGEAAVLCEEVNNEYFVPSGAGVKPKNNQTTFVVFQRGDSADTTGKNFFSSLKGVGGPVRSYFATINKRLNSGYGGISSRTGSTDINNWTDHYACCRWNDTADDWELRMDGASEFSGSHDGTDLDADNNFSYYVGDVNQDGSPVGADWDGHIAEVVHYQRDLPQAQIDLVETYLADKYGI